MQELPQAASLWTRFKTADCFRFSGFFIYSGNRKRFSYYLQLLHSKGPSMSHVSMIELNLDLIISYRKM
ncbi:hypothetical protein QFZ84_002639 [Pseudomonas fluorescens]